MWLNNLQMLAVFPSGLNTGKSTLELEGTNLGASGCTNLKSVSVVQKWRMGWLKILEVQQLEECTLLEDLITACQAG